MSLLNNVLEKSVMIGLNNGSLIEGFILKQDEEFLLVLEYDNNRIIARKSDISFVRIYEGSVPHSLRVENPEALKDNVGQKFQAQEEVEEQDPKHIPLSQQVYLIKKQPRTTEFSMEAAAQDNVPPIAPKFERET